MLLAITGALIASSEALLSPPQPSSVLRLGGKGVARCCVPYQPPRGGQGRLAPQVVGEFVGVTVLMLLGGGVAFSPNVNLLGVALIWGFAVHTAIHVAEKTSDAHLNPAVTLAVRPRASTILAQCLGSLVASVVLTLVFNVRPGQQLPFYLAKPARGLVAAFAAEAVATAILVFVALTTSKYVVPVCVASLIAVFGPVSGAGLNPARDLGPRLVQAALARGTAVDVWQILVCDSWPFLLGPVAGGMIGAYLHREYDKLVWYAKTRAG
ncbi:hypothetical protein CTAYLR_002426 [Chrysophaeum taylorii]|uniref:Aquaporin n=1 Tax=Chrysophaeum taylorii TaxID=2483200 RepID=A0AAD7XQZ5_9STRA|nr:hypothetical protein CTAYLR_002426 [Chrysophaeum taylorii]